MNNNLVYCTVNNVHLRKALVAAVTEAGFKLDPDYITLAEKREKPEFLLNDPNNKGAGFTFAGCAAGLSYSGMKELTIDQMFDFIAQKLTFKLNDTYTLERQSNGDVEVGCQTIDKATMTALIEWYNSKN